MSEPLKKRSERALPLSLYANRALPKTSNRFSLYSSNRKGLPLHGGDHIGSMSQFPSHIREIIEEPIKEENEEEKGNDEAVNQNGDAQKKTTSDVPTEEELKAEEQKETLRHNRSKFFIQMKKEDELPDATHLRIDELAKQHDFRSKKLDDEEIKTILNPQETTVELNTPLLSPPKNQQDDFKTPPSSPKSVSDVSIQSENDEEVTDISNPELLIQIKGRITESSGSKKFVYKTDDKKYIYGDDKGKLALKVYNRTVRNVDSKTKTPLLLPKSSARKILQSVVKKWASNTPQK